MKSRFKFSKRIKVAQSPYKSVIEGALKRFAKERPLTYDTFSKNVKAIRVANPPRIANAIEQGIPVAWTDTRKPGVVFISKKEFEKAGPPENVNPNQVIKTLAHETPHAALGAIPDTREEEKLATKIENTPF